MRNCSSRSASRYAKQPHEITEGPRKLAASGIRASVLFLSARGRSEFVVNHGETEGDGFGVVVAGAGRSFRDSEPNQQTHPCARAIN